MNIRAAVCTAIVFAAVVGLVAFDLNSFSAESPEAEPRAGPERTARASSSRGAAPASPSAAGRGGAGPNADAPAEDPAPGRRWAAPNGKWSVVQDGAGGSADLVDASGRTLDGMANLMDGASGNIIWSPRSDWFYINHSPGTGLDRLRVFQVVNGTVVERSSVFAEAARVIVGRYPCLDRPGMVLASGQRWSRDGQSIVLVAYAKRDACTGGEWQALWMIGDAQTGRIDPASVRVRSGGVAPMPEDGPYARL